MRDRCKNAWHVLPNVRLECWILVQIHGNVPTLVETVTSGAKLRYRDMISRTMIDLTDSLLLTPEWLAILAHGIHGSWNCRLRMKLLSSDAPSQCWNPFPSVMQQTRVKAPANQHFFHAWPSSPNVACRPTPANQ